MRYRFLALFIFFSISGAAQSEAAAPGQCRTLYGVTYTQFRIDPNAVCHNGRDSALVFEPGAILPHYDEVETKQIVRRQLAAMRAGGVDMIRSVIWYTQDRIPIPWGQMKAPLQPDDAARLKDFGEDIRAAGFKRWLLSFSPGIRDNPACRLVTWGDCYIASRALIDRQFIADVHKLLAPLGSLGFKLEYDLSSERCPSKYLPEIVNRNIWQNDLDLIQWYSGNVSKTDFHFACGGPAADRIAALLAIYAQAGVKPNAIDIHFYDTAPALIAPKLVTAWQMAQKLNVPLLIGEMQGENPDQISAISSLVRSYGICLDEVIEWPLRGKSMCQMNVEPPLIPRMLRSEVP